MCIHPRNHNRKVVGIVCTAVGSIPVFYLLVYFRSNGIRVGTWFFINPFACSCIIAFAPNRRTAFTRRLHHSKYRNKGYAYNIVFAAWLLMYALVYHTTKLVYNRGFCALIALHHPCILSFFQRSRFYRRISILRFLNYARHRLYFSPAYNLSHSVSYYRGNKMCIYPMVFHR